MLSPDKFLETAEELPQQPEAEEIDRGGVGVAAEHLLEARERRVERLIYGLVRRVVSIPSASRVALTFRRGHAFRSEVRHVTRPSLDFWTIRLRLASPAAALITSGWTGAVHEVAISARPYKELR